MSDNSRNPRHDLRVGVVQMTSTADKARNLQVAEHWIAAAARRGARLIVLPEMFNVLGPVEVLREGAEPLDGPTMTWAKDLARSRSIWLAAGSMVERTASSDKYFNTSCLVDPHGAIRAAYRKLHLFDCDYPGAVFHESAGAGAGNEVVAADMDGVPLGLAICYDLRFPELFRALTLMGARIVAFASAFLERTGRDHWEVLLRARAIENQVFMLAANQVGLTPPALRWYGRSMIVDPWGIVLAQANDDEGCIVSELDLTAQDLTRAKLPCLQHRRPECYR